jgi:hypothetical protein
MKKLLVLITLPCFAMDVPEECVLAHQDKVQVSFAQDAFTVNGKKVQRADLDEALRKVRSEDALKSLLGHNYLQAKRLSNGEYKLTTEGRLEGGTPLLAGIAWVGIKALAFVPSVIAHAVAKKKDEREGGHRHRDKHPSVVHRSHHVAENLDRASSSVHAMHGHGPDVVIEAGTNFIVDETGVARIVDPYGTGDHAYLATMMVTDPASRQQAQGVLDRLADSAYEALKDLPPVLGI